MKKALLVVSFGTSYHDTCEKNIVACERDLAASCPDRDLFRAFTSGMIIRKLRQRDGIDIDTPLQALQKLAAQGYQDVAIQSLHIINGDEYEKIVREVQTLRPLFTRLTLGVPLLSSHNDYVQLMQALRQQMPSLRQTEKVVFMGHGASHHAFAAYACLDHMMTVQRFPARVGAVESYPEVDILIDSLRDEGVTGVHLMPLMLVAGDHAINDMASDDGDSWKMRFNAAGIPATPWLSGLGENPANGELFTSDRRWSGGYLVRARGGGDSRRGCAVVSGAIAGARRPDDAWRKWNVDGGDWPGCRLSGVENGLPCRTVPRCRRFSVRDAGGFGDLFCDFSPAWRCVSRSPCRSDRVCCEVYGDFLPHTDSCRHCRRFINRHDL